jgi:putative intracellular protease/amidase
VPKVADVATVMHIQGKKVAILATNGFEQSGLEIPRDRLKEHGAIVHVVSPQAREIRGWEKKDWGRPVKVDVALDEAHVEDYDAIVLPGGTNQPRPSAHQRQGFEVHSRLLRSGEGRGGCLPRPLAPDRDQHPQGTAGNLL